jgi:solute carrier family 38 (sodium-coupled neutral amino acid transporter), member 11
MPKDDAAPNGHIDSPTSRLSNDEPESGPLIRDTDSADDNDQLNDLPSSKLRLHITRPPALQRQSSLSQPRPPGTPRTTNRVRFEIEDQRRQSQEWVDEEDYLASPGQDAPLLTDITPPSDSPFLSEAFQPEDHLPNARPKSGMRSAIMNMANSIIGAGRSTAWTPSNSRG